MSEMTINIGLAIALLALGWLVFKVLATLGGAEKNTTAANLLRGGDGGTELEDDQAALRARESGR